MNNDYDYDEPEVDDAPNYEGAGIVILTVLLVLLCMSGWFVF